MPNTTQTFGELLKSFRKERKVSARTIKLGARTHNAVHIGAIETNRVAPPSVHDILAIAGVLGLGVQEWIHLIKKAAGHEKPMKVTANANENSNKVDLLANFMAIYDNVNEETAEKMNQVISAFKK